MEQIGKLYQIEKEIRELTPDERYKQRQERSKPLLDVFFKWLYTLKPDVDRSSKIGEAILYAINQERYLRGYLEDGHLSIDNNPALYLSESKNPCQFSFIIWPKWLFSV